MARRHGLAPQHRVADAKAATRAMTVLHATEPATPYLSLSARIDSFTRGGPGQCAVQVEVAGQTARDAAHPVRVPARPAAGRGERPFRPGRRQEYGRLVTDLERSRITGDGAGWLAASREAVLARLAGGAELSATQLREDLAELAGQVSWYEHKPYGQVLHIAPRVLTWMGATGDLVRGHNDSHWRITRPLWARMDDWLGAPVGRCEESVGYAELVASYLRTFGPVTERDLVWWFGATKRAMRQALSELSAVQVRLEREQAGWVLPDDVDPEPPAGPWAALLPALDPTTMGWKDRDFYVDPDFYSAIFDWSGNCGTTAWWNGQIVGAYVQDDAGHIELIVPRDPGPAGRAALQAEGERLGDWLDGEKVSTLYKSPLVTWDR